MSTPVLDSRGNYEPKPYRQETTISYRTPSANGVPVFENAKQIATGPGSVRSFYGNNSSSDELYVVVTDTADGENPEAGDETIDVVTVPSAGFVSIAEGDRFKRGFYVKAYTDPALTTEAGDVMSWNAQLSRM